MLQLGREGGSLCFEASSRDVAKMIIGGPVGAMLLARSNDDVNRFRSAASLLLATVAGQARSGDHPGDAGDSTASSSSS